MEAMPAIIEYTEILKEEERRTLISQVEKAVGYFSDVNAPSILQSQDPISQKVQVDSWDDTSLCLVDVIWKIFRHGLKSKTKRFAQIFDSSLIRDFFQQQDQTEQPRSRDSMDTSFLPLVLEICPKSLSSTIENLPVTVHPDYGEKLEAKEKAWITIALDEGLLEHIVYYIANEFREDERAFRNQRVRASPRHRQKRHAKNPLTTAYNKRECIWTDYEKADKFVFLIRTLLESAEFILSLRTLPAALKEVEARKALQGIMSSENASALSNRREPSFKSTASHSNLSIVSHIDSEDLFKEPPESAEVENDQQNPQVMLFETNQPENDEYHDAVEDSNLVKEGDEVEEFQSQPSLNSVTKNEPPHSHFTSNLKLPLNEEELVSQVKINSKETLDSDDKSDTERMAFVSKEAAVEEGVQIEVLKYEELLNDEKGAPKIDDENYSMEKNSSISVVYPTISDERSSERASADLQKEEPLEAPSKIIREVLQSEDIKESNISFTNEQPSAPSEVEYKVEAKEEPQPLNQQNTEKVSMSHFFPQDSETVKIKTPPEFKSSNYWSSALNAVGSLGSGISAFVGLKKSSSSPTFDRAGISSSTTKDISHDFKTITATFTLPSLEAMRICPINNGLSSQNFKCIQCRSCIGIGIPSISEAKLCDFNGHYYCNTCFEGTLALSPYRVILNWDFTKKEISAKAMKDIREWTPCPCINLEEYNPSIFELDAELSKVKKLRLEMESLSEFLRACPKDSAKACLNELSFGRREHLAENSTLYSLQDLYEIHAGTLSVFISSKNASFKKHIMKECPLCSLKGSYCEYCSTEEIIYPFQDPSYIYKCPDCRSICHKDCLRRECLKCKRKSTMTTGKVTTDVEL